MSGLPGIDFPGVGCGLVIKRDGKVLLCRRMKSPEADHWSIPGGKVDHLEPAFEAARREATEETGLKIGDVSFLCTTEQIIPQDRQHWVAFIYVTENATGEAVLTEPDKIAELGWFDLDNLPEPMSVFAAQAFSHLR